MMMMKENDDVNDVDDDDDDDDYKIGIGDGVTSSTAHILVIYIMNMSGKIVIIIITIITTIIIIIINGYRSINISSHTEKKKTKIATSSIKL
ncbi:hypothetical protein ElyMa_000449800 [Elysia marginata]|uniref:Uncharacterized protein n=1 Tax=Elysia marginata TaxID=1093978 RepID=A0AAV4FQN5_9GAST|nr:hypothetical protein ElyMa_000449800 [Elysia marginata]